MSRFFLTVWSFFRRNPVMSIALCAAAITAFIVPPDEAYLGYFDFKTLSCLFSVLAVVGALRNIRFFDALAHRIVHLCHTVRFCALCIVYITFLGSMLIANDMALLTFLPLGYMVLTVTHEESHMAPLFILQNIAANLGGMLTPFGNPQNLYLYGHFEIPDVEFLSIMAPSFLLSMALFTGACILFFPKDHMALPEEHDPLPPGRTALYLVLFALSIIMVFRILPFYIGLAVIVVVLLFSDRKALLHVDYPLLLTFFFFFIFAGNMSRIGPIRDLLSGLLSKSTLWVSTLSCQVISNVPSAILLSQFTDNYRELLIGVNIGGTGTLVASLASLITFRQYRKHNPGKTGRYLLLFSAFNFTFLIILLLFNTLILYLT